MLVTTNTFQRNPIFRNETYAREAIEHLYRVQANYLFFLYGFVIMPDHCHFLMNVPAPGSISKVMNVYKSGLKFQLDLARVWQPRFHIVIPEKPWKALEYIHLNPVRKNLCERPEDYPWSSASGKWDTVRLEDDFLWET